MDEKMIYGILMLTVLLCKEIFQFILKYRKQSYDQTITLEEANKQERIMQKRKLDHEYRMAKIGKV